MKFLAVTLFAALVSAEADPVNPEKCNTEAQTDIANKARVTECSTMAACTKDDKTTDNSLCTNAAESCGEWSTTAAGATVETTNAGCILSIYCDVTA